MQLSGKQQKIRTVPGCAVRAIGFISIQIGFILVLVSQSFNSLYQSTLFWSGVFCLLCGLALFLGSFLRKWGSTDMDDIDE
ncbi:MAG TPA: hypothetical protein VKR06_13735 [Ktedonosporobacter sp.]|nr:hypothetical protein [Ktedonosporobacter sp.]